MSAAHQPLESGAPQMTVNEVRRRAAPLLRAQPRLTVNGFYVGHLPAPNRDFDDEQVLTAALFLLTLGGRRKTFNSKADSYSLKHNAENWGKENGLSPSISNGAFILAALICGYEYRRHDRTNCIFNMPVNAAMRRYDWHVYGRGGSRVRVE
jgi:hypothetical protein